MEEVDRIKEEVKDEIFDQDSALEKWYDKTFGTKEAARKRPVKNTLWAGFILIVALAVFLAMLYAISTYAEPLITDQMTIILTLLGGLPLW